MESISLNEALTKEKPAAGPDLEQCPWDLLHCQPLTSFSWIMCFLRSRTLEATLSKFYCMCWYYFKPCLHQPIPLKFLNSTFTLLKRCSLRQHAASQHLHCSAKDIFHPHQIKMNWVYKSRHGWDACSDGRSSCSPWRHSWHRDASGETWPKEDLRVLTVQEAATSIVLYENAVV